jgi:2-polyprenyl-6-methoxyphenol hydroxylase-like FAD-dependent oxidoreductase
VSWDIVIVGAGPAGLATAIAFGSRAFRVLVCERGELPKDKACGEGLMPSGLRHLRALGIAPESLPDTESWPFVGIRYISANGRLAQASFSEGPGLGIRRARLSAALLERAAALKTVQIRERAQVELRGQDESAVELAVDGEAMRSKIVVGADGLHSTVRRWAGLQTEGRRFRRYGIRQHFAVEPWSDHVEVHWSRGIEAYVTPVGRRQVGLALLWDASRVRPAHGGVHAFAELLQRFPILEARLENQPTLSHPRAAGPLEQRVHRAASGRVALVGDAAGYVDALTGEGLSLALSQARLLADTLASTRELERAATAALKAYARRVAHGARAYRYITRSVLWLGEHPRLLEYAISTLARDPKLFQALLSANMGTLPLSRILARQPSTVGETNGSSRNARMRAAISRAASIVGS